MDSTSVTSKGQVTIPQEIRRKLGIRQGSRVAFRIQGGHAELRIVSQPADVPADGYGLLKSSERPVPTDFDPAALLMTKKNGSTGRKKRA